MLRYALCGNPNCGKTTLFNALTGKELHTGNYSGVTVSVCEGELKSYSEISVCDLPGVYSLEPVSEDEQAAYNFLTNESYDGIIAVLDGTCIERGLYLVINLMKLNRPMLIAVNMADECETKGIRINTAELENMLGAKVFLISAAKGDGVDEIIETLRTGIFCKYKSLQTELNSACDVSSVYAQIDVITKRCVESVKAEPELCTADKLLLASPFSVIIFVLLAVVSFVAIFDIASPFFTWVLDLLFSSVTYFIRGLFAPGSRIGEFVCDGILGGVSSVIGFLPAVVLVFLLLSVVEDSGYAARISVIFEGIMGKIGLGGRSVIPLILGLGCTVPAVTSLKAIKNRREKRLASIMLPFMPCSAKIPVITMFVQAFFKSYRGFVMSAFYLASVFLGAFTVFAVSKICGVSGAGECVTELPPYRFPSAKNIWRLIVKKCRGFLAKAVSVILFASAFIWTLSHIGSGFSYVSDYSRSLLYNFGGFIAPLFAPLGFGFPEAAVSLLCGFAAKEAVLSTLTSQFGVASGILPSVLHTKFGFSSAVSYLIFVLLYPPCISAQAAYCAEFSISETFISVMLQFAAAYTASFAVYHIINASSVITLLGSFFAV